MKSVALHNLGCKVNSYEIEVMQQILQEKGYNIVSFDKQADIYIINTCTVTNIADRKSRQMLHRAKAQNPNAVVVAVGCYVQTGGEDAVLDKSIDLAIGNNRKKDIVAILEQFLLEREGTEEPKGLQISEEKVKEKEKVKEVDNTEYSEMETSHLEKTLHGSTVMDLNHTFEYEEMTLTQTAEHTRAYIKIQDGCNQFCSYCIIPYARGRVRSRRAEDIIHEVEGLANSGYQEIVLTGIHISSYGIDFEEESWIKGRSVEAVREEGRHDYSGSTKLIDLVELLHKIEGIHRIRLGSLEPRIITWENAKRLAQLKKLCPHFHLSLQSGCEETLKRMNRHYTPGEYYQSVEILRKIFHHPAITTDVIVGFPGETEEEFRETRDFIERICFYEMHVFKYSRRKGTKAADRKDQIPEQTKTERSNVLLQLEKEQSKKFRSRYIGRDVTVLFEEQKVLNGRTYQLGHTADYVKVALETTENLSNCLKKIRVSDFLTDEILNSTSMH